jgi:hypothetical protein
MNLKRMNVFEQLKEVKYIGSHHAVKRCRQRTNILPTFSRQNIQNFCKRGEILLEVDDYRYIRFKDEEYDLFFPCIKWRENAYVIKTTLRWDMVEYRLQKIIDNYHMNDFEVATY